MTAGGRETGSEDELIRFPLAREKKYIQYDFTSISAGLSPGFYLTPSKTFSNILSKPIFIFQIIVLRVPRFSIGNVVNTAKPCVLYVTFTVIIVSGKTPVMPKTQKHNECIKKNLQKCEQFVDKKLLFKKHLQISTAYFSILPGLFQ